MQRVQRRFGKLLPRTADETQVSLLLKDFDDADSMLGRVSTIRAFGYEMRPKAHAFRSSKRRRPGEMHGGTSLLSSSDL